MSISIFFVSQFPFGYALPTPDANPLKLLSGIMGTSHTLGSFLPWGNAGTVTFINSSDESLLSHSGVYLDATDPSNLTLTGIFFLQNVWWTEIKNDVGNPAIVTPPSTGNSLLDPWIVSGLAWNENAGWMSLDSLDPASYSWIHYLPATQSFTGYAWSDTLGYIDFWLSSGLDVGFIGKVKIIGNIGWNKSFDVLYNLGSKFNSVSVTGFLNTVRKNIAILYRGISPGDTNGYIKTSIGVAPAKINDSLYYKLSSASTPVTLWSPNLLDVQDARSLIVEWTDVYINADILLDPAVKKPRAIIAMKDASWNGGNIYISSNVKNIYASLVAEWSIYSGDSASALYNDTKAKVTNLPANQLYIYGMVISRNTIGWSTTSTVTCPYTEATCDRDTAIKYDLNYFRTYDKDTTNGSLKIWYDDYSLIIEYDPLVLTDPPPGISQ